MEYLQKLCQLEPFLLPTNKKTYRITYTFAQKWLTIEKADLWQTWYLCKVCAELGRTVRIQDLETGKVIANESSILNLFSICLSGRYGQDRKS